MKLQFKIKKIKLTHINSKIKQVFQISKIKQFNIHYIKVKSIFIYYKHNLYV